MSIRTQSRTARRTGSKPGYGWVPDIPDQRDYLYGVVRRIPARPPKQVDLRPLCSAGAEQRAMGRCTAHALAGARALISRGVSDPYLLAAAYASGIVRARPLRPGSAALALAAAFVALLMAMCDRRHSATQYALLSALAALGRVYVGPVAGEMAKIFGWPEFFLFTFLAALPGVAMLVWQRRRIESIDTAPRD